MCYRCFRIAAKTSSVVQVIVGGEDLCYRSMEAAEGSCVPQVSITSATPAIMLWSLFKLLFNFNPHALLSFRSRVPNARILPHRRHGSTRLLGRQRTSPLSASLALRSLHHLQLLSRPSTPTQTPRMLRPPAS